jgi:carbonic anhydrase
MGGVVDRGRSFVRGLVEHGGWSNRDAQNHFKTHAPNFEIGDVIGFVQSEALRLSRRYPRVVVAPLFYSVEERVLYQVDVSELK